MCYSKCLRSDACIYYSYDAISVLCIVCLRRIWLFENPKVGSHIGGYDLIPTTAFSRIGVEFDANACNLLDYSCATRWFGSNGGSYGQLEIANGAKITSILFCKDMYHSAPLGGFTLNLDSGESHSRGCASPDWYDWFQFAENESITSIEIYYGDGVLHGLLLHTNASNIIEGLSNDAVNAAEHCVIERGDLAAIETRSGSWMDAIRFRFHDC